MNAKQTLYSFFSEFYYLIIIISMTMGLRTIEIFFSLVTNYQINEESILLNSLFESLVLMFLVNVKYIFRVITMYDFSLPINLIIKQKPFRINGNNSSTSISSNSNSNPYSYFR